MNNQITITEAAKTIGISRAAVWQAVKQGIIDANKIGPIWVLDYNSVLLYKQKREISKTGKYPRKDK